MQIEINDNNCIIGYSTIAEMVNGIEIPEEILPNDFFENPFKYCYSEEKGIYLDPNYDEKNKEKIKIELAENKDIKILESKKKLNEWLINNPILYTDGKYYSVTEEKQALLNGNLASYERAAKIGIEYPLKWNSTGEECTDWNYTNLLTLSLNIAEYVAPRVS